MGNFYEAANFDWREIKREGEKNDVALDRRGGLFCPRVRPHPHNKARKKCKENEKKAEIKEKKTLFQHVRSASRPLGTLCGRRN